MDQFTNVDIYFRFFVALSIIIGLIGVAAWFARSLGFNSSFSLKGKKQKRLAIVDSIPIDAKRRLVLVSRDEVEHLVCVGGVTDFIVEKNVKTSISLVDKDTVRGLNVFSETEKAS